jgi:hypothetical protein
MPHAQLTTRNHWGFRCGGLVPRGRFRGGVTVPAWGGADSLHLGRFRYVVGPPLDPPTDPPPAKKEANKHLVKLTQILTNASMYVHYVHVQSDAETINLPPWPPTHRREHAVGAVGERKGVRPVSHVPDR